MGAVFAILVVIIALAAIGYVWRRVATEGGMSDGTPGSVMDANEDVRRIDMGMHVYAAQQAHAELTEAGFTTKLITLEAGTFGMGMGDHYYLVYNAGDEAEVRAVVDHLLDETI